MQLLTVNCSINVAGVLLTLAVVSFGILGRAVQSHSRVNGTYLNVKTAQTNKVGEDYNYLQVKMEK